MSYKVSGEKVPSHIATLRTNDYGAFEEAFTPLNTLGDSLQSLYHANANLAGYDKYDAIRANELMLSCYEKQKQFIAEEYKDVVSYLIIAEYLDVYQYSNRQISDYNPNAIAGNCFDMRNKNIKEIIKNIEWKVQNPMEQVSSTFFPDAISTNASDYKKWLLKSPLIEKKI